MSMKPRQTPSLRETTRTKPVAIIAGPTASGKSGLALELGEALGGADRAVIINADSMQLYRELPLMTACPDARDMARLPHRLYGVLSATDRNSAADWRRMALAEISAAHEAGQVPILVGGTGFYIKALVEGLSPIPAIPEQITDDIRQRIEAEGAEALHAELKVRDPKMAAKLRSTDAQRIARALSVLKATGISLAEWQAVAPEPPPDDLRFHVQVVMPDRAWLYRQCDARFALIAAKGGVDEVRALLAMDLPPYVSLLRAVGVPEIAAYCRGEMGLEEAIAAGQQSTRHYAKRQYTWFRNQLPPDKPMESRGKPPHDRKLQVSHVQTAQLSESFLAGF